MNYTGLSIFKFFISIALLAAILYGIDFDAAVNGLLSVRPEMVVACIALYLGQALFNAWRWVVVQEAIGASLGFGDAIRIVFIGRFFNQALPSSAGGDAVRVAVAYNKGLVLSKALSGVVIERGVTVISLMLITGTSLPVMYAETAGEMLFLVFVIFAIMAASGFFIGMMIYKTPTRIRRWRVAQFIIGLLDDMRMILARPGKAAISLAVSVVASLILIIGVFVLALGLSVKVTFLECLVLVPLVMLASALPISIGGWGVREGAMVGALGLLDVPSEAAVALSVLFGVVVIITALPGGLVWLKLRQGAPQH